MANVTRVPCGQSPLIFTLRAAVQRAGFAAAGAGLMFVSAAASPAAPAKDPLADDARLAQQVRVTAEGLAVSDLLARLSARTGVALVAEPDVGDEKVIVFGPARPLRELLADLAALFNIRWEAKRTHGGEIRYRLYCSPAARQLEAGFARRIIEEEMACLNQDALISVAIMPKERTFLPGYQRGLAGMLYRRLSPAQHAALFRSDSLRIPFRALTPAQRVPLQALLGTSLEDSALADQRSKPAPAKPGLSPFSASQSDDLGKGEVWFRLFHAGRYHYATLEYGKHLEAGVRWDMFSTGQVWSLPVHGNPYTREPVPADASLPASGAIRAAMAEKAWPDRLRRLAEDTGMSLLADYYRVPPFTEHFTRAFPDELARTIIVTDLDTLCELNGSLWWMRGKSLLLRQRDWFFSQRPYEVPDRWLLQMVQRAQRGPFTCADVLRVLDLTDDQILGLRLLTEKPLEVDGITRPVNRAEQTGGLRKYLAIAAASPRNRDGRIENTQIVVPPSIPIQGLALKYKSMTPLQRRLIPVFLAARNSLFSPADAEQFSLLLSSTAKAPETTPSGYKHVPFRLAWDMGKKEYVSPGWTLDLPASLPDDRREQTRVEVVP